MELKLDLHIHSTYSPDSFNTIDIIHDRLRETGLNGYALADHDSVKGFSEAKKKSGDLVMVPALEVSSHWCHILAFDPIEAIPRGLEMMEAVDLIHDQGATAILAHPYGIPKSWINISKVEKAGFDAIEVANSAQIPYEYITSLNRKLAERLKLPITGGSDSHIPETIGRAYTTVETESTDYLDVIKAIRLGRTSVAGTHTRLREWFGKWFR